MKNDVLVFLQFQELAIKSAIVRYVHTALALRFENICSNSNASGSLKVRSSNVSKSFLTRFFNFLELRKAM